MAEFSIDEDMSLLLLAPMFEGDDDVIDWQKVVKYLGPTTRTTQDLQQRLHYLTRSDTSLLDSLPEAYIAKSSLARFWQQHASDKRQAQSGVSDERQQQSTEFADRQQQPANVADADNDVNQVITDALAVADADYDVNQVITDALADIFGHITKKDVMQPSGQAHLNVGEISPLGVTAMLEELQINDTDIFIDVGSGTGNILVQVILMSQVQRAIGLEIRSDLAQKSRQAIEAAKDKYILDKVDIINGDIKDVQGDAIFSLMDATVVYCNNFTFQPDDNLGLHDFIVNMYASRSHVRAILLTKRLCIRHTSYCKDVFCKLWEEKKVLLVPCTWTEKLIKIYVYTFRKADSPALLTQFNELIGLNK